MVNDINALFEKATQMQTDGKINLALKNYEKILKSAPMHYEAVKNITEIYLQKKQPQKAEQLFLKSFDAVDISDSNNVDLLNNVIILYLTYNYHGIALQLYTPLYDTHKNLPYLLSNMVMCHNAIGNAEQGFALCQQYLKNNPDCTQVHHSIGRCLYYISQKNMELAQQHAKWWVETYPDNADAKTIGNGILGNTTDTGDIIYTEQEFDEFARSFEETLSKLTYDIPQKMHNIWQQHVKKTVYHILDIGCGTGLVGEKFRPVAQSLSGIDISAKMLKKAEQKGIYDYLEQTDINTFLQQHTNAISAVLCADVMIYIGDVTDTSTHVFNILKSGGYYMLSIETCETAPFVLDASGRYKHNMDATIGILKQLGFDIIHTIKTDIRTEAGNPIDGAIILAQKP